MRRAILFAISAVLCAASVGATTGEGGGELAETAGASAGEEPGPGGECPQGTVRKCRCRHEGECEPDTGDGCKWSGSVYHSDPGGQPNAYDDGSGGAGGAVCDAP